ncbi:MAG: hypothetical protein OXI15_09105 [Chromatiales bacterium]|nr:hypothetical protein [Chromatiales bacterium]
MRLLFDQGTPAPLRHHLADHSVDTLVEKGWSDKGNGELLDLAGHPCDPPAGDATREMRAEYAGVGWTDGSWLDYDREHYVDLVQLAAFLHATRPEVAESLGLPRMDR